MDWLLRLPILTLGDVCRGYVVIGVHGGQGVSSLQGQRFGLQDYGPPHYPGLAQTVEPTRAPPTLVPILRRTNSLYGLLFHKTDVRPWPVPPLNTMLEGGRID